MLTRRSAMISIGAGLIGARRGLAFQAPAPEVRTTYGTVSGFDDRGVKTFLGIRYGADTGGKFRFMPPRPPEPWSGVREQTHLGATAIQSIPNAVGYSPELPNLFASLRAREPESEDCLFLNVWTPGVGDGRKRPVMVWIHPGGFTTGAGCNPVTNGRNIAEAGDVVLVSFNHRLGVFGYLDAPALAPYMDGAANVAQLDQIAALQWVRDNIAEFGGDPTNVTIFGQSGGGAKVCTLLAMPAAKGLFHRAIVESGIFRVCATPELGAAGAEALLKELGMTPRDANRLRDVPAAQLLSAFYVVSGHNRIASDGLRRAFGPTIDPATVPSHADSSAAARLSADIPLVIGTTRTDIADIERELPGFDITFDDLEPRYLTWYRERIDKTALSPARAHRQVTAYRRAYPHASAVDIYYRLLTMLWPTLNTVAYIDRKSALQRAPVYLYEVAFETTIHGGMFHSPHSVEEPLVFRNVAAATSLYEDTPEAKARAATMTAQMSPAWTGFARNGNPNHRDMPVWPRYTTRDRSAMIFDLTSSIEHDYRRFDRQMLAGLPLVCP